MTVGSSRIDGRGSPSGSHHDTAAYSVALGGTATQQGQRRREIANHGLDEPAIVLLPCRIDDGVPGEQVGRACHILVVVELMLVDCIVLRVKLGDTRQHGLAEDTGSVVHEVSTKLPAVVLDSDTFQ